MLSNLQELFGRQGVGQSSFTNSFCSSFPLFDRKILDKSVTDERGNPTPVDALKVKGWVYVEGVHRTGPERIEARKIYILSKRIEEKDKALYPFFK
jgi:hypothetical protein